MSPWWGPTTFAKWLVTTFITCGRSTEYLVCGAMFARGGCSCNSTSRQLGRDGIQWRRERRDFSPDDDWHAWRVWRTARDRLWRVRQPGPLCSFLVSTGFLRAWPGTSGRACYIGSVPWKSARCVNLQKEKEEASRGYPSLHVAADSFIGPWLFPAEDEVRAGDV